jgi:hypothetical protein
MFIVSFKHKYDTIHTVDRQIEDTVCAIHISEAHHFKCIQTVLIWPDNLFKGTVAWDGFAHSVMSRKLIKDQKNFLLTNLP